MITVLSQFLAHQQLEVIEDSMGLAKLNERRPSVQLLAIIQEKEDAAAEEVANPSGKRSTSFEDEQK